MSADHTSAATSPALARPRIAGYEVLGDQPLGRGGMGAVWRAVQLSTRRQVALKVIESAMGGSDRERQRFRREIELTASLEHPHIARVYDGDVHHGGCFYAMELVEEATDLAEYARRLSPAQAMQLVREVCLAVQHAHERTIIHRDLKPSNVLVDRTGHARVVDFGLARNLSDRTLTPEGYVAGTLRYMSPEQADGRPLTTATDVYSLGVILYEVLTGEHPHDVTGGYEEVRRRIIAQPIKPPRQAKPSIDREVEALLCRALAQDPADRYASAGELARDIDNYLRGEPLTARAPTTLYFLRKRLWKYRVAFAITASVFAVLLGMALWTYIRTERARRVEAQQRQLAEAARAAEAQQRKEAQKAAARAEAVSGFLQEMLASADPLKGRGTQVTVRQVADEASKRIDERFKGMDDVRAELHATLGRTYSGLGLYSVADGHLRRALAILRAAGVTDRRVPDLLRDLSPVSQQLDGDEVQSIAQLNEALSLYQRLLPANDPIILETRGDIINVKRDFADRTRDDEWLGSVSLFLGGRKTKEQIRKEWEQTIAKVGEAWRGGDRAEAGKALRRQLDEYLRLPILKDMIPTALVNAAFEIHERRQDAAFAEVALRLAPELSRELHGQDKPEEGDILHKLGQFLLYAKANGAAEAVAPLDRAADIGRRMVGKQHPEVIERILDLGRALHLANQHNAALAALQEGLESAKAIDDATLQVQGAVFLADELISRGEQVQAQAALQQALATLPKARERQQWQRGIQDRLASLRPAAPATRRAATRPSP